MFRRWEQHIFSYCQRHVGKYALIDQVLFATAQWGIFVLYAAFGLYLLPLFLSDQTTFWLFAEWISILLISSLVVNYVIALLFPVDRPYAQDTAVNALVTPLADWKSFPSDHSMLAALPVLFMYTFFPSAMFVQQFVGMALFIMYARIYTGVHYPRDIFGGMFVALAMMLFFFCV